MFFQSCNSELVVIVHIHLKNPIMIGKKKTKVRTREAMRRATLLILLFLRISNSTEKLLMPVMTKLVIARGVIIMVMKMSWLLNRKNARGELHSIGNSKSLL
jgi:hypothetical protein